MTIKFNGSVGVSGGISAGSLIEAAVTPGTFSLKFAGTGNYTSFDHDANLVSPKTVEAWLKFNTFPDSTTVIPCIWKVNNFGMGINFAGGGVTANHLHYSVRTSEASWQNASVDHSTVLTLDQWHHVAGTYDGSTIRLFVDGSEVDNTPTVITQVDDSSRALNFNGFTLPGPVVSADDGFFQVDDVRLWNVVRTETQINDNKDLFISHANLIVNWRLEEGSGTALADTVGTVADGTLTGSTWITN